MDEDELIEEYYEETDGYIYPRYRDDKGRFASEFYNPDREFDKKFNKRLKQVEKEYREKIFFKRNVKILLLQLVDDFSEHKYFEIDKDGFETGYPVFPLKQFKRKLYHDVLLGHPLKRSAFSQFVNRMVDDGLIVKIMHGHKLYLRITKEGFDKIYRFWCEYPGESWRMP